MNTNRQLIGLDGFQKSVYPCVCTKVASPLEGLRHVRKLIVTWGLALYFPGVLHAVPSTML